MEAPKIVGAKYRVIKDAAFFNKGAEVTLVYDDGTDSPWFSGRIIEVPGHWYTPNGPAKEGDPGAVLCVPCWMGILELIKEAKDLTAEVESQGRDA